MIHRSDRLSIQIVLGLLVSFLVLLNGSTNAQYFEEEGMERGLDTTITTVGLGGPGVSTVDFDQDGDDDLTLGSNGGVLFYQNNSGQFQLIDLGIETPPGEMKGVIWTDINNDGNLDLFLSSYVGGVRLYKNIGGLEFEDITDSCGISNDVATNWGVCFSDINRDGFVDLQLCRYQNWLTIPESPSIQPEWWTRLYLNNGDETFTDFTIDGAFIIEPATVFLGVFLDFNNDLWPDNHTIVDRVPGNRLFLNTQGSFIDITEDYEVSFPNNDFMSNTIADYDNDGDLDIFMTNNGEEPNPSYLLRNDQGESMTNVASSAGVEVFEFCWGAIWIDANNDGWQDLFIGNRFNDPNFLFLNDQGTFTDHQDEMVLENDVPSFSAAKGDFDNDGFYDIIIQARTPNLPQLLMNQESQNRFLKITPHGTVSNSMATGSWIKLYAESNEYVHFTLCGEGFISQNSQHLIFGLGEETTVVDSLSIWYPSGHTDVYFNLLADSVYHFYEGETYQVNIIPNDTLVCPGEEVILDAGEHLNYEWNTGETTRFISTDTSGVYSVTVTNEFGISASNDLEVEILPVPIITNTISPNACRGDSMATISLENLLDTFADSVFWDNGMTGEMIDSLFSGDYAYVFTDVNGCVTSGTASVIDPPDLLVFANSSPEDADESNGSIVVTIFGGVPPYVVIFDGDTVSTAITNVAAGEYTISIIDAYGCTATIDVIVDSTLGLRNKLSDAISVYPNPSSGKVQIKTESEIAGVFVYNSTGRLLEEPAQKDKLVNLENFPTGLYLLKIELSNSAIGYFRVIKE